ncbi:glucose-1-phosphate thymidylyltransferase [Candidatus Pacearchaeota archaeon]|nr:glucose-1-phosphate thymidylyltransferase [Candidatus Pacearchaeota archaeon]|tara:strand:+ start:4665 stop:5537 length:873 start_codon:yes stop_codon:yes gene_type:complete
MKGIILAAGRGSRLYPTSLAVNKQLMPIYDKPMIYYPLTTLIENRIDDICIICNPEALSSFKDLLGDGHRYGAKITYKVQREPKGIAESFIIASSFLSKADGVTLILGDNIFYGAKDVFDQAFLDFGSGATVFGYRVHDPERYGVVEFDENGKALSIQEKPKKPKSDYAIPGFYIFDNDVVDIAMNLKPSKRGELEITDVIKGYLRKGSLRVRKLPRGTAWLDAGTCGSFYDSSSYVQAIEKRQGIKIGCPEEAAYINGFLTKTELRKITRQTPNSEYKDYLKKIIKNEE